MKNTIITISREYGSGGRDIGKKLAEQLSIPFYDNELITIAVQKSGYAPELFKDAEQNPVGSWFDSIPMYGAGFETLDMPLNDKMFLIQSDVIKDVADKSSCVIVGRCADYVLRDFENCIKVFIHADLSCRMDWAVRENDVPAEHAKEMVRKIDKRRADYYNHHTGLKWGDAQNYDLCINSAMLGVLGTVEVIKKLIELKNNK